MRDYAAKLAEKERGMAEMSEKFRDMAARYYVEDESGSNTASMSGGRVVYHAVANTREAP